MKNAAGLGPRQRRQLQAMLGGDLPGTHLNIALECTILFIV